jgi:Zinc-ribbon, C4HC2 type
VHRIGTSDITCSFTVQDTEQLLCAYSETLRRWSALLQATEVSKHMLSSDRKAAVLKNLNVIPGGRRPSISKRGVVGSDDSPLLEAIGVNVDYVTLVRLGVNCSKCGKATDSGPGSESDLKEESMVRERSGSEKYLDEEAQAFASVDRAKDGRRRVNALWCIPCKDYALICSLCQMAIRGAGYFCSSCGHGGHTGHMRLWFEQTVECAAGCGCRCGELAVIEHGHGSGKGRYNERDRDERAEHWDSSGEITSPKSSPMTGGARKTIDREALYDRQTAGDGYFLYHSEDSSERGSGADQSVHSDGDSEYDSDREAERDRDGLSRAYSPGVNPRAYPGGQGQGSGQGHGPVSDLDTYQAFSQDWES